MWVYMYIHTYIYSIYFIYVYILDRVSLCSSGWSRTMLTSSSQKSTFHYLPSTGIKGRYYNASLIFKNFKWKLALHVEMTDVRNLSIVTIKRK